MDFASSEDMTTEFLEMMSDEELADVSDSDQLTTDPTTEGNDELTIEDLSGTYERKDGGLRYKLVLENSGTFKDYFENFPSKTFAEQASGDWKLVDEEVHLSYQTPADYAKRGLIHIYSVQQDGSLSQIAGIADGKRHDLSKEQQAETLDWMKR